MALQRLEFIKGVYKVEHPKKIGIFPGSFDPMTNGHVDLIQRAAPLFDELIVLIAVNTRKNSWFSIEEKVSLAQKVVGAIPGIRIDVLKDGLIADYYKKENASAIVRGIRNATDFDYECSIDAVNKKQFEQLETLILFASEQYRYLSSSMIKEIAYFNGNIEEMVPEAVAQAMVLKCSEKKRANQ